MDLGQPKGLQDKCQSEDLDQPETPSALNGSPCYIQNHSKLQTDDENYNKFLFYFSQKIMFQILFKLSPNWKKNFDFIASKIKLGIAFKLSPKETI